MKIIDTAYDFSAHAIRIYGGATTPTDTDVVLKEKRNVLIEEMYLLGEFAKKAGVFLVIENHFNTMANSALKTKELVQDIGHPNVRILYDQANLDFTFKENYQEALDIQKDFIEYVHIKDFVFLDRTTPFYASNIEKVDESERSIRSCVVGEGEIDWHAILKGLIDIGYDGWLSLEYEKRWHSQDLPDAHIGVLASFQHVKQLLASLGGI